MEEIIKKILGNNGRMVSMSKGRYRHNNPDNIVVFNSNICTKEDGKIFYGDIDITLEESKLLELAKKIKKEIYVLSEMDGRFENEENPKLDTYIFKTDGNKSSVGKMLKDNVELRSDGKWYYKKVEPKEIEKEPLPEYDETDKYKEEKFIYQMPYIMSFFRYDKSDEISPLEKFYNYVETGLKSAYKLNKDELGKCKVYITIEQEEKLTGYVAEYLIKHHGLDEDSYDFKKEMGWLPLNMPYTFYGSLKGPRWVKDNMVYVELLD